MISPNYLFQKVHTMDRPLWKLSCHLSVGWYEKKNEHSFSFIYFGINTVETINEALFSFWSVSNVSLLELSVSHSGFLLFSHPSIGSQIHSRRKSIGRYIFSSMKLVQCEQTTYPSRSSVFLGNLYLVRSTLLAVCSTPTSV